MSEEIVYANLKIQDPDKKEETQKSDKCGGKVSADASHSQQKTVLILILLCLLLFIGMGVLGGIFYTTLATEMIKSNQLQRAKEELQENVFLQLKHNLNSSKKIKNLSAMLQSTATQLCRELYSKEPEHKCKPCPKGSEWYKDSCYSQLNQYGTWQESVMACSARNASLLKVKNKDVLEFIKYKKLRYFWLALLPRKDRTQYPLSEKMFLSEESERSTDDIDKKYCGYIDRVNVYYTYCTDENNIICEETASKVQLESVLNGLPEDSR
uniref:C-type lectin domain family 12 member A n=1 Tax=Mus musculus TaxID=10090 RepID=CL12A_MOUSE|nr:RecName: Full=C-type lectin domain family 12 member A; AltName: Full=C-type lectin-like molecule 1; Short=CLL-1; AltName: Full=Myeloid inhibitory C-type lectin-like receptor; Short=MICL; AltName: CD_antigen=CD371 [Mus musculus]AAH94904.1 C-type lectin domain family 12, member a [Mus musculus]